MAYSVQANENRILLPSGAPAPLLRSSGRIPSVRARYDAAQTSSNNARHWLWADDFSADAANSKAVRNVLRRRSRYEFENNSYFKGMVLTQTNHVIGNGPQLNVNTENEEFNDYYESMFSKWSKTVKLARKLRSMGKAKYRDGEACGVISTDEKLPFPIKLNIAPVECDRLTDLSSFGDPLNVDGVILSASQEPIAYVVLKQHPGNMGANAVDSVRISEEFFIHWFRCDRPEQHRGIPEFTSSLEQFAQLRRYTGATLDAAESAARLASVIETSAPAMEDDGTDPLSGGDAEDGYSGAVPMDTFSLERNQTTVLPDGYHLNQLKPEQPTATYKDFKAEIINEIGRGVNMPYNIASGNSSGYNYASGRLDHQSYYKDLDTEHDDAECLVLDKILRQFHFELALLPESARFKAEGYFDEIPDHTFLWAGQIHVDPQKEAGAFETLVGQNGISLSTWFGRQGLDYRKQLVQIAREKALVKKLESKFQVSMAPATQTVNVDKTPGNTISKTDDLGDDNANQEA